MDPIAAPSGADLTEEEYALAEREGKRLDSVLCADCPDPGLCASLAECDGRGTGQ
jgi:hypothetical protein